MQAQLPYVSVFQNQLFMSELQHVQVIIHDLVYLVSTKHCICPYMDIVEFKQSAGNIL